MKIFFSYKPKARVDFGDEAIQRNFVDSRKDFYFENMIVDLTFKHIYKNENNIEKLFSLLKNDINNNMNKLEIINMDARSSRKSPNFKELLIDKGKTMPNVAFILKGDKIIDNWKTNGIVFFCKISVSNDFIKIQIRRIEFIDIPYLDYALSSSFHIDIQNENKGVFNNLDNKNLVDKLSSNSKIYNKNDHLAEQAFNFDQWRIFTDSYLNFLTSKNESNNLPIVISKKAIFENKDFQNLEIIITSNTKISESKKMYISSTKDDFLSIPISMHNLKQFNLSEDLDKESKLNSIEIEKWDDSIVELENILNIEKSKYNEKDSEIRDLENSLKKNNLEISKIKNLLSELNQKNESKEYLKHDSERLKDVEHENESMKKNLAKIKLLTNEKNLLSKNIREYNDTISMYNKNISDYKKKNMQLSKIQKFLKNKNIKFYYKCEIASKYKSGEINFKNFSIQSFHSSIGEEWNISEKDLGKISVARRYKTAISNSFQGTYRNPFLIYSLFQTPKIPHYPKSVSENIIKKYELNDKQLISVNKAINIRDIFYLQGPPGTGKTQTICAITEQYINNNEKIIMTSSTHEAIDNFFERLEIKTYNDPNFILFKYMFSNKKSIEILKDKKYDFSEKSLYWNFIKKISNAHDGEGVKYQRNLGDLLNDYIEEFGETKPEEKTRNELEYDLKVALTKIEREDIEDYLNSKRLIRNMKKPMYGSWDKLVQTYSEVVKDDKQNINNISLNQIKDKVNDLKDKDVNLSRIIKLINQKINKRDNDLDNNEEETSFLNYIIENQLINVIGITTTARNSISILNKEMNLFSEYPIDLVIIDEISKSTTPEIINRAILAKKVIFSGDYKQLPPTSDIDENEIQKLYDSDFFNEYKKKYNINNEKELEINIKKLFQNSFFKNQIMKLKENSSSNSVYDFLNIQHRFDDQIMKIVNHIYDHDEKLQMPKLPKKFNIWNLNFDKVLYDSPVNMIDTSHLSDSFLNELKNNNIKINNIIKDEESFDQKNPLFEIHRSISPNGIFSEYNAFIILKTLKNILKYNKNDLIDKIGVIVFTKNQKNIITNFLKHKEFGLGIKFDELAIKVDTIDNFQGRERDIIIVDFIRAKNALIIQGKEFSISKTDRKRNVSFIKQIERINVAVSRAGSKLILVGSFSGYLNGIESDLNGKTKYLLREYLIFCEQNGNFIKAWEVF